MNAQRCEHMNIARRLGSDGRWICACGAEFVPADEVERLKKDVDRWEATSYAQAHEEHKLRAEVERLRGLVREAHAALNADGGISEVECGCDVCKEAKP